MKTTLSKMFAGPALFFLLIIPAAAGAERQTLHGHVPETLAKLHLQPVGRLSATNTLHFGIILPLRNNDALGKLLQEQQNTASTNFHRYLTPDEFNEKFGPTEADYQAVISFARTNSFTVTHTVPGRSLVRVDGAVADVEKAFQVTMRVYQHPTETRTFFAPDVEPSLDLAVPVLAITSLNDYVIPIRKYHIMDKEAAAKPKGGSYTANGNNLFMGYDFRRAFAPDTSNAGTGQVVGLQEFQDYTPADIITYEQTAGLPNVPIQEVKLDGLPNNRNNGDLEPALDIEMAISMAPGLAKVVFYYGKDIDSILTEMAEPLQGEPLPQQLSSSFGYNTDGGTSNLMMRLAAQGQSYFYASGDEGAMPVDPNGPGGTFINGASPGDLEPFMTQVGGTDLTMQGAGLSYISERVWGNNGPNGHPGGSSGGILTTVPIPDYQKPVSMSANRGSTTQCNVPDVAMPASGILVVVTDTNGIQQFSGVVGTSCAAPLWAGFAALVNQQAAAQGKAPIGYATPAIYQIAQGPLYASCFHDITNGNSTWSNSPTAYFAVKGYDLCTGWGTPAGASLINALVGFSGPVFIDFNYTGSIKDGNYDTPFVTLAGGTNAVSTGGTIIIKTAGSSSETMTIKKPMTITAGDGAGTVGH